LLYHASKDEELHNFIDHCVKLREPVKRHRDILVYISKVSGFGLETWLEEAEKLDIAKDKKASCTRQMSEEIGALRSEANSTT
jgi:hypothetical protein